MAAYILKRVVGSILLLLMIMVVTFYLMNAIPGSPFLTEKSTPEQIAAAEAKYGLDKPLHIQLWNYIKNFFTETSHIGVVESFSGSQELKENLNSLRVSNLNQRHIVEAEIHVSGKRTVTAADIEFVGAYTVSASGKKGTPVSLEKLAPKVQNPGLVLAELNEGESLDLSFNLTKIIDSPLFDFGVSLKEQEGTPVSDILFKQGKFECSLKLGICAMILAIIIGIPLGCLAAYFRGTWLDGLLRVITTVGVAIPTFVLASLLLIGFTVDWPILPTKSNSLPDFKSYVLPVISLSFYYTCYIAKLMRTSMLDAINQDYIRTARAKGVKTGKIVLKHALRNSLIPVVTYLGPVFAGIITGSFVVESIFSVPGLGKYFVSCVTSRDYPIIMATTIVLSALVIFMMLVVDIVYKIIDPRITLTSKEE